MRRENEHEKKQIGYCEQDILDQIARLSEDTEVPDSLRPENIDTVTGKGKKQKKHFRPYHTGSGLQRRPVWQLWRELVVWQYGSLHEGAMKFSGCVRLANAGMSVQEIVMQ